MTVRRGISLIELLVAMVLFAIVASLAMMVFANQNRSFKMESERAEAALMAKGTLDELTHAVRMTGSNLPDSTGGIRIWRNGVAESTTFVMYELGGQDTLTGYTYDTITKLLHLKITDSKRFSDQGFVLIPLTVPPSPISKNYTVPIQTRMTSKCGDSLILNATPLAAVGSITTNPNTQIYNIDFVTYLKRNDTLFVHRNRQRSTAFAVGIDTLEFLYWHPEVGWKPTLWTGTDPALANQFDKVNIRLVTRNLTYDAKRFQQDSNSRGYNFSVLETEVSLRNTRLVNQ
jgi:prepilin-type N-terminal cleavage/methylation domain-containing protein